MAKKRFLFVFPGILAAACPGSGLAAPVIAAPACGHTEAGFAAWRQAAQQQAAAAGIGKAGLEALAHTHYARDTIAADRNQKVFKLSLEEFMRKRGAEIIIKRGRSLKQQNAALFADIERQYGVPAGPLLAIWGMETVFGTLTINQKHHTLSAVATLAYDCRRSKFFTEQLYAALKLVDKGDLDPQAVGAAHGEIGQTQFLPLNVLKYGVDADGDGRIDLSGSIADALASAANFLKAHGWQRGQGYRPGEPNFAAIEGWNKAEVYQKALTIIAQRIDAP